MTDISSSLLKAIVSLTGRTVFPESTLASIVRPPRGQGGKLVRAFNLCDGTRTQAEVAKALHIGEGSLSRTVSRWIRSGVLFRIGEGREARLMHVYPLSTNAKAADDGKEATPRRKKGQSTRK